MTFKEWFEKQDENWCMNAPAEEIARAAYQQGIEAAATKALEQRCERGTPWDHACVTIAEGIRTLAR